MTSIRVSLYMPIGKIKYKTRSTNFACRASYFLKNVHNSIRILCKSPCGLWENNEQTNKKANQKDYKLHIHI